MVVRYLKTSTGASRRYSFTVLVSQQKSRRSGKQQILSNSQNDGRVIAWPHGRWNKCSSVTKRIIGSLAIPAAVTFFWLFQTTQKLKLAQHWILLILYYIHRYQGTVWLAMIKQVMTLIVLCHQTLVRFQLPKFASRLVAVAECHSSPNSGL